MRKILSLSVALLAASPLVAQTYTFNTGSQFQATALTGFSTDATQMTGMTVRALFSNGATFEGVWGSLGSSTWGVNVNNWFRLSMAEGASTYTQAWNVTNLNTANGLTSIQINGAPGRTLFDVGLADRTGACESNTVAGTVGSAEGCAVKTLSGTYAGTVRADFTNIFAITGNAAIGDMFEQLTVNFTSAGGLAAAGTYSFRQDTDNSPSSDPPPSNVVPEPSTYALMATGLFGLLAIRRRRSQR